MKVYGYQQGEKKLIELREVSFQTTVSELEKIIEFLQDVKIQHSKVIDEVELCHSHFRDWNVEWKPDSADIIVVTTSDN